jgi:hypothetical protein
VPSTALPGAVTETEFADFWTRSSPSPDAILMTASDIEKFNLSNPMNGKFIIDVLSLGDTLSGSLYRSNLETDINSISTAKLYVTGDILLETPERARIAALMDPSGVPDVIKTRFGMTLRPVIGKCWPTHIPLAHTPNDNEFDQAVVSLLDTAEPVALIHSSPDGLWVYVQAYGFTCWVPSDAVAFGDKATVMKLRDSSNPLVVTGHIATIRSDPRDRSGVTSIRMGTYLPVRGVGNSFCRVLYPSRGAQGELTANEGYIEFNSGVSLGFLPYTKRNIFNQLFVPYGRRYGWGGMYEERDCSAYVLEVFRCFGFRFPRNSQSQLQASNCTISLDKYNGNEKLTILKTCPPGITLVGFPGHIMVYLGEYGGKHYAVSSLWAWRSPPLNGREIVNRTGSIVVTSFAVGEGSEKGSFLDRLTRLSIIGNYILR